MDVLLRCDFLTQNGLRPKAFLDELYRIVSRHPDYDHGAEPDFAPATPWWEVARHLITTFNRLLPEGFHLRMVHEEGRLALQPHYQISRDYDIYLADVSFLPLIKRQYRALHDLAVSFLALLVDRSSIGDWSNYLDGGTFYEWVAEQDMEERDPRAEKLLRYYALKKESPTHYYELLRDTKTTTEELRRRFSLLRPGQYPEPLQRLIELMKENLTLLDDPELSLVAHTFPDEQEDPNYGYPVSPDEYISLVWHYHKDGEDDPMQQAHYGHIEMNAQEYGLAPLGELINCRADEPYTIEKQTGTVMALLSLLEKLQTASWKIKTHYGVIKPKE